MMVKRCNKTCARRPFPNRPMIALADISSALAEEVATPEVDALAPKEDSSCPLSLLEESMLMRMRATSAISSVSNLSNRDLAPSSMPNCPPACPRSRKRVSSALMLVSEASARC